MKYTHVISEDGRKIAACFSHLLTSLPIVAMPVKRLNFGAPWWQVRWARML
jgi:hypothetical protein